MCLATSHSVLTPALNMLVRFRTLGTFSVFTSSLVQTFPLRTVSPCLDHWIVFVTLSRLSQRSDDNLYVIDTCVL